MASGGDLIKDLAAAVLLSVLCNLSATPVRGQAFRVEFETRDAMLVADLLSLDSSESLELDRGGPFSLPTSEVLHLRFERASSRSESAPPAQGELRLLDGGRLPYQACERDDDTLRVQLTDGSACRVRWAGLRSWWLERSAIPSDTTPRVADVLWVKPRRGSGVTPVEGVVLGLTDEGVRFALASDETSDPVLARWPRLAGIEFFREPQSPDPRTYRITTSAGQVAVASGLRAVKDRLVWESRYGSGDFDLTEIETIDLSTGRVTSVSQLELLEQSWRPFYELSPEDSANGFALNTSLTGGSIRLLEPDPRASQAWPAVTRTRQYDSGVALKSRGVVRFALPPRCTRLKGRLGLDPSCFRSGSAEVSVVADERVIWQGTIDGATAPVEINAPLQNEAHLTLRVDYGDNLDAGDHVHFADLRVIQ